MEEWKHKAIEAAVIVVVIAVAGRVAWMLLRSAVPLLVVLIGLVVIYGRLFHKRD